MCSSDLDYTGTAGGHEDPPFLTRNLSRKPWRPTGPVSLVVWALLDRQEDPDALYEATVNEVLLSIALAPNRILSIDSTLTALLIRAVCCFNRSRGLYDATLWSVWELDRGVMFTDHHPGKSIDCGRLLIESGCVDDLV